MSFTLLNFRENARADNLKVVKSYHFPPANKLLPWKFNCPLKKKGQKQFLLCALSGPAKARVCKSATRHHHGSNSKGQFEDFEEGGDGVQMP